MKKQITAIVLCTVLLLTTFAACGKKYMVITDEDGYTHFAVTNENGNTVVNSDGNIAVFNTDKNGDAVTNSDGSLYTEGVAMPSVVVNGQYYETPDFRWEFSEEWTLTRDKISRNGTSVEIIVSTLEESNYDQAVSAARENVQNLSEEERALYAPTEETVQISGIALASKFTMNLVNPAENIDKYVENYYFQIRDNTYQVFCICDAAERGSVNFASLFAMFIVK